MKLSGWGRYPSIEARVHSFETEAELRRLIEEAGECIVFGMGRSYGDTALARSVLRPRRFNKMLSFDSDRGMLTCESGVTFADLLEVFLPRGWFPAVTPGTRFVTMGGAIAADVHGKNHHKAGCFSESVASFDLMLPTGKVVGCSREENPSLFRATCGGIGLTGVILNVSMQLERVRSAFIRETVVRCRDLGEVLERFREHASATYSVAWIDCLAGGKKQGRSILMLGEPAEAGPLELPAWSCASVPFDLPGFFLNRWSVSLFNHFYYHSHPGHVAGRLTELGRFFYPLDSIGNWNRIYGRQGFCQYQLVLPEDAAPAGLREVLGRVSRAGKGSFLAVLKLLGPQNNNLLSFPMEGYTLCLDFKIEPGLFPFLAELDDIVLGHGGRLYLAKDARMPRRIFRKGYPGWERLAELRELHGMDRKFKSLQSHRLGV